MQIEPQSSAFAKCYARGEPQVVCSPPPAPLIEGAVTPPEVPA